MLAREFLNTDLVGGEIDEAWFEAAVGEGDQDVQFGLKSDNFGGRRQVEGRALDGNRSETGGTAQG